MSKKIFTILRWSFLLILTYDICVKISHSDVSGLEVKINLHLHQFCEPVESAHLRRLPEPLLLDNGISKKNLMHWLDQSSGHSSVFFSFSPMLGWNWTSLVHKAFCPAMLDCNIQLLQDTLKDKLILHPAINIYKRNIALINPYPASHDFCCLLSHLLIFLGSLYCKQYGPRLVCSLIRVHSLWISYKI